MSESEPKSPDLPGEHGLTASDTEVDQRRDELVEKLSGKKYSKYVRFIVAAALGSIPWIGGFLSASVSLHAERGQEKLSDMQRLWLREHEDKIARLGNTLGQILQRLDALGDNIQQRIESEAYLSLIRKGFRSWDQAETEEKRELIRKLLVNAGGTTLCSDDVVRLFIEWIDKYHELHFRVIKEIYKDPGVTRARIWENIYGDPPREDSAEADLFKLLMRDLSTGGVLRQERPTNAYGQFIAKRRTGHGRAQPGRVLKSAFDDEEPYVLTELGKQFVHYTMDDIVPRIG